MEYIEVNSMNLGQHPDTKLKLLIVETELERVKFLIRGYLRQRLAKVFIYIFEACIFFKHVTNTI